MKVTIVLIAIITASASACTPLQLQENTLEQIGTLEELRFTQILTNISNEIARPDSVPAQGVTSGGVATNSVTGTLALQLTQPFAFARNTKMFNPMVNSLWQNNWSITPISDPQDLQNLRALYGLMYLSNDQIAELIALTIQMYSDSYIIPREDCGIYFGVSSIEPNATPTWHIKDGKKALPAYLSALDSFPLTTTAAQNQAPMLKDCYHTDANGKPRLPVRNPSPLVPAATAVQPLQQEGAKAIGGTKPSPLVPSATAVQPLQQEGTKPTGGENGSQVETVAAAQLNLLYGLIYPTPGQVHDALRNGISYGCRKYQLEHLGSEPLFVRWLFWKGQNSTFWPADSGIKLEHLGYYGSHDFWTSSSSCLSDFIILLINSTANSHAAALNAPKPGPSPALQ